MTILFIFIVYFFTGIFDFWKIIKARVVFDAENVGAIRIWWLD